MAALVLGLLVSSAKTSYDTTRAHVIEKAAKYALLDRLLGVYGPQAAEVRVQLHAVVEGETRRLWPDDGRATTRTKSQNQMGNAFYVALLNLEARDDVQRTMKAQAVSLAVELGALLTLMEAETTTSISKPMLIVVALWLVTIFVGFSAIAPPNATARFSLTASALCVAGAIFLILELDQPFSGVMRISSEPMLKVLGQLGK